VLSAWQGCVEQISLSEILKLGGPDRGACSLPAVVAEKPVCYVSVRDTADNVILALNKLCAWQLSCEPE
jgi:hypothetical protein